MFGSSGFMEPAAVKLSNCGSKETTKAGEENYTLSLNKKVNIVSSIGPTDDRLIQSYLHN